MRVDGLGRVLLAIGLIGLGVLSVIYGDFALQWQPVPSWVPWRQALAYVSGAVMLASGVGLLFRRAAAPSSRVLIVYLVFWWVLLKIPRVVMDPSVEGNWLGCGEIAVLVAGGWVLFATLGGEWRGLKLKFATGEKGIRLARLLFAIALPPIGLSHFVYTTEVLNLVPAWLPERPVWAYLAGSGHIAAGLGVLLGIYPRLAATLEAGMISAFTLLVWVPGVAAAPTNRLQWTAFVVSWTIGAAAWVVADSYRGAPWRYRRGRSGGNPDAP